MPSAETSKETRNSHVHLIGDKELIAEHTALYLTQSLRAFAISVVGIFLPIYIFINSGNLLIFNNDPIINGIIWGFAYFFLRSFSTLIFASLLIKVIFEKIHLNRAILFSTVIQIIEIYLWILAEGNMYWILLAGFLCGLKVTLFWIPYHTYFVKKFKARKYGNETGTRMLWERALTGIAPLIGGLIISKFGFGAAFLTSIVLLVASALPIIFTIQEWKHKVHTTEGALKTFMFNRKYLDMTVAYLGEAADIAIYTVAWPILLFIGLASFIKIGILTAITSIITAITTLFVGKAIDKHGTSLIHGIGVFINTLLYLPRVFVTAPIALYAIDIADRLNSPLYSLPNLSISYEKAHRSKSSTDFIIYREFAIHVFIALITLLLILILMNTFVWRWIFFVAAAGSSLLYLMDLDSN